MTPQSAQLAGAEVTIHQDQDGDGTVPFPSAIPTELEGSPDVMVQIERHASLQNADGLISQVLRSIELLTFNWERYRLVPTVPLGLELDDVYLASEPINVSVQPDGDPGGPLTAVARNVDTELELLPTTLRKTSDDRFEAELSPLPEGVYRLTVSGAGTVEPVTDVFSVFPEAPPG
jgi:hypothetical protein